MINAYKRKRLDRKCGTLCCAFERDAADMHDHDIYMKVF